MNAGRYCSCQDRSGDLCGHALAPFFLRPTPNRNDEGSAPRVEAGCSTIFRLFQTIQRSAFEIFLRLSFCGSWFATPVHCTCLAPFQNSLRSRSQSRFRLVPPARKLHRAARQCCPGMRHRLGQVSHDPHLLLVRERMRSSFLTRPLSNWSHRNSGASWPLPAWRPITIQSRGRASWNSCRTAR